MPFPALYGLKTDAVYTGAAFVGPNKAIGIIEDICPIHLVIKSIEAKGWFLLGLEVQLPLQCPDVLRG